MYTQVADIVPGFTDAWYNKGLALMHQEKYLEAICAFDRILKINSHERRTREQRDLVQKKIMESVSFFPQSTGKQTKLSK
jgi:tetratricopeptide (TPR) repeat protein